MISSHSDCFRALNAQKRANMKILKIKNPRDFASKQLFWTFNRAKSVRFDFGAFKALWSYRMSSGLSNSNFEINLRQLEMVLKQNKVLIFFEKIAFFLTIFHGFLKFYEKCIFCFKIPIFHTNSFFLTELNFYQKWIIFFLVKAETSYFTIGKSIW